MIHLADPIPTEILRNKSFMDWFINLLAFAFVVKVLKDWFVPPKREITGSVETREATEHAEKSELIELKKTVDSLREEMNAQFRQAQTAGENRVSAITQDINEEMSTLSTKIGELAKGISTALIDNASQGADINNLKAADYRHDQAIASIRQRIDELVRTPHHRKT